VDARHYVAIGWPPPLRRHNVPGVLRLAILAGIAERIRLAIGGHAHCRDIRCGWGVVGYYLVQSHKGNQSLEITLQLIAAVLVPVLSFGGAIYATRSQLRQAEIARAAEERKITGAQELDLARFKREVEQDLWQKARAEFAAEREARQALEAVVREMGTRISELEAENRQLRADNVALTAELMKREKRNL
jgi:hypothetical protein